MRKHTLLLVILIAGAFLRFYQLGAESLWYDEVVSVWFAQLKGPSEILEASKPDPNFPPYYLILHYWVARFGDSEFSARLPSALAGIFAILALYGVGSQLFGRSEGLMASLILTLSPLHLFYSQEARVYEAMALLALLSFYFFLKVLKKGNPTARAAYVLCTAALLYSHVYGLFIVLAQNLYLAMTSLLAGKRSFGLTGEDRGAAPGLGSWVFLQAILFVLYVPGLVTLPGKIRETGGYDWIPPPSLSSVYADIAIYAGSPLLLVLFLTLSFLATIGLIRRGASGRRKLWLLLAWFLAPVVLPLAISLFVTPIFHYRYGIAASPALYLLAAKGVGVTSGAFASSGVLRARGIPRALGADMAWLVVTAALIALSSGVLWSYFNTVDKTQWREAAGYVDAHTQANDLVFVYPQSGLTPLENYYLTGTDLKLKNLERVVEREKRFLSTADGAHTRHGMGRHNRIWLVHDLSHEDLPYDAFFSERSYTPVYTEEFGPYDHQCYPYYPVPCGVLHGGKGKGIVVTLYEKK